MNRRRFIQLSALANAGLVVWGSQPLFAQGAALPPPPAPGPIDLKTAGGMDALIAAARQEGELSTTGLPDDWANYKGIKRVFFREKYSFLRHNDLTTDASSGEIIEQIRANAGNRGPQNPDVIDVGFVWGARAKAENLLQPYRVATWDTIPAEIKDPDGFWYGNYFGSMAFEVNANAVPFIPQDWQDLLDPRFRGMISINDPTASSQSAHLVWASTLGNGGTLAQPEKGIAFFKELAQKGNLVATSFTPASLVSGELPITLRWDFNALANRDNNVGRARIEVIYPKSGTLAGVYVQAINAFAPRPHAARLWVEFLYSDAGQLLWLEGYSTPVRYQDMLKRGVIPQALLDRMPEADVKVEFPTLEQVETGLQFVRDNWVKEVGITYQS